MVKKYNIHDLTLTIIKRNGCEIKIGYGFPNKNPLQMAHHDKIWTHHFRKLVWIYYDGDWYISSKFNIVADCINYINNHPTYSKEQLFELIYDLCE